MRKSILKEKFFDREEERRLGHNRWRKNQQRMNEEER